MQAQLTTTFALLAGLALTAGCDNSGTTSRDPLPSDGQSSSSSSSGSSSSSSSSGGALGGMTVSSHTPAAGASRVALVSPVRIVFNRPALNGSFADDLLTLHSGETLVEGRLSQTDPHTFEFVPAARLAPNTQYQVLVGEVMSSDGEPHAAYAFTFTTVANIGGTAQNVIDNCMNSRDINMLAAVNEARSQSRTCGPEAMPAVASLSWNCQLREAAQAHSNDMASHDFFSHAGSDGSNPGQRIDRTGYRWSAYRENLAAGQQTINQVMTGLLNSDGHCLNIMASNVTQFGLGYTESSRSGYRTFWTQVFASPRR